MEIPVRALDTRSVWSLMEIRAFTGRRPPTQGRTSGSSSEMSQGHWYEEIRRRTWQAEDGPVSKYGRVKETREWAWVFVINVAKLGTGQKPARNPPEFGAESESKPGTWPHFVGLKSGQGPVVVEAHGHKVLSEDEYGRRIIGRRFRSGVVRWVNVESEPTFARKSNFVDCEFRYDLIRKIFPGNP
ncbi:hypothetical protein C8R44DRAFT_735934 [Mycena epipterygia]|nr:hypothetical protein C8R44DRAFT_735934 [Mycena epipterygia]